VETLCGTKSPAMEPYDHKVYRETTDGCVFSSPSSSSSSLLHQFPPGKVRISEDKAKCWKSGKTPAFWMESYEQFDSGLGIKEIHQGHSKKVQESTVLEHLMTSYEYGRSIDLNRLLKEACFMTKPNPPPTISEAEQIRKAAACLQIDSTTDERYRMKPVLAAIPELTALIEAEAADLSGDELKIRSEWYSKMMWWKFFQLFPPIQEELVRA
jgi:hypothetical protein